MTAKGEAQVKVKIYEGERNMYEGVEINLIPNEIPRKITERLMATIESLERQRIKVVGRELPEVAKQGDVPTQVDPDIGKDARR